MRTWLWALNTAKLWSEGSTMNCWRGRAFTSPWWPCRAKETRLWTRKLNKVGWDFGQSLFPSTKSLPLDDFCTIWEHESALILSLGLVADKEEELPGRLSRAGSYRASLRYCTYTLVSNCLSCVYNINFCCPDCTSKKTAGINCLPEFLSLSRQKPSFNKRLQVCYYHKDEHPDGAFTEEHKSLQHDYVHESNRNR